MQTVPQVDAYSAREIALAAGVEEADVVSLAGCEAFVPFREALRIGRALKPRGRTIFSQMGSPRPQYVPLALSSTLHLGLVALALLVTAWMDVPAATPLVAPVDGETVHLLFLATPGPGGGGGGGGLLQVTPPPKALREGHLATGSPLPAPEAPTWAEQVVNPTEPTPLTAEPLPMIVAPIVVAPADSRDRIGVLLDTAVESESRGSGRDGGVGGGAGTGLGERDGRGVGPGSGGGVGGGAYRPGSGVDPPRVLREVKADYPEEARRRGIAGDVVLEIVVRRDGSVGDVRIVDGLGGGLSERAVQAVRQWQFAPARRQGAPVDVIVEVAIEFKLR